MAAFDPARNCHLVRIVFDGPALAGKTTNLQRLEELLPAERRTELFTPGALKGRTMFFDWLEVDGPLREGLPVKLQLITVPGQKQRSYRRRPLVMLADVLVFVADTSPFGIEETKRSYRRLQALLRERTRQLVAEGRKSTIPLLVQANKQDVPQAVSPKRLAELLRLPEDTIVIPASTIEGRGVETTLASALKVGLAALQAELQGGGIEQVRSETADPDSLFFMLLDQEEPEVAEDDEELAENEAFDAQEPTATPSLPAQGASPTPPPASVTRESSSSSSAALVETDQPSDLSSDAETRTAVPG